MSVFWGANDPSSAQLKLSGDTHHAVESAKFNKTKLSLGGMIKTNPRPRDILFLVDVSGSMQFGQPNTLPGSDPLINGSCGRLRAVQTAIQATKAQGISRFAVVTFNRVVVRSSGGYFSSLEEMFPNSVLTDIFCAGIDGTNYTNALREAITVLNQSPASHLKELYFLTDGEPMDIFPDSHTRCDFRYTYCNGANEANFIKNSMGALLGTLMLGENPTGNMYLENHIAGVGPSGELLHINASNSVELVESLSVLSRDNITEGAIAYRGMHQNTWSYMNMLPMVSQGKFKSHEIEFDSTLFPQGIEVRLYYNTERGHTHTGFASITWSD